MVAACRPPNSAFIYQVLFGAGVASCAYDMSNQQPLLDRAALRRDRHCACLLCPPACMFTTPGYGEAWRWMLPLACTFLNECICLSMLYPFLGYMVLDFGLVESTNEAGLYVGYIASMFTLGQLLSGSFWGSASDRWGRRRVICIGLFNTMLLAPLFGLSRNLWQAMAVRFAMGLLSGNAAAAKAYIGEAVTPETQDMGFSLVAICWSIGNVCAASLGGFLSRPAVQFPNAFGGTIFESWPYLLPCTVAAAFAGIGCVVTLRFLPSQPRRSSGDATAVGGQSGQSGGPWGYVLRNRRCRDVFLIYFCISWLDYGAREAAPPPTPRLGLHLTSAGL